MSEDRCYTPLGDGVALMLMDKEESGILVNPFESKETNIALVVSAGPRCREVKGGETVIIDNVGRAPGNAIINAREGQILAVLNENIRH